MWAPYFVDRALFRMSLDTIMLLSWSEDRIFLQGLSKQAKKL